ncbi:hypothetical protein NJ69_17965 [Pseudomonas parafulva]|nr:hypothetical protein NJ69_17965 [Pseudomonas parafulva]
MQLARNGFDQLRRLAPGHRLCNRCWSCGDGKKSRPPPPNIPSIPPNSLAPPASKPNAQSYDFDFLIR